MGDEWWRNAIVYQVYPRSFADSDGDGVGDLAGLRERLPHIADLGADAVWLSPFYRSPMVDGGYDVSDYRDVDPMFGTLADFDAMLARAHELRLRVIVDIVPNHSSSAHPWFREALASPPGSAARARYHFRDRPNDWESVFGGPAWTRVADGQWYLHLFDPAQPDLNWDNPEVHDHFADTLRFWLERGVDGFRIDVAHGMAKAFGLPDAGHPYQMALRNSLPLPYFDQDEVLEIHRSWRKILDGFPGERIAVAEVWAATPERLARYVSPGELHQAFNFDYLDAPWSAPALRAVIERSVASMRAVGAPPTWVMSNHDRVRHLTRYGGAEAARAALLLMLALPGAAYVYQGEELGLPEVTDLPDDARRDPIWTRSGGAEPGRDGCRVPIPWEGTEPPYGFGPGASWLPQPKEWAGLSVAAQHQDPTSMLTFYRQTIAARKKHLRSAPHTMEWLPSEEGVLRFRRPGGLTCTVDVSGGRVEPTGNTVIATETAAWTLGD
ncbi:alpha-glucosidase [Virgisporangium aliadipatigenens]|uniref:Alpha-glucosidase n=1 Tax=Virgisporangium aliadipatigenens TaxID=741659 RepID=A0A8J4DWI5_9ACTN|nr:glycoside hydrolase family 13 protein [Virgisporangium aliadipatigenens]GIJ51147.1 alpha-glucosidase [Virgisporangium aliadipatigenens]